MRRLPQRLRCLRVVIWAWGAILQCGRQGGMTRETETRARARCASGSRSAGRESQRHAPVPARAAWPRSANASGPPPKMRVKEEYYYPCAAPSYHHSASALSPVARITQITPLDRTRHVFFSSRRRSHKGGRGWPKRPRCSLRCTSSHGCAAGASNALNLPVWPDHGSTSTPRLHRDVPPAHEDLALPPMPSILGMSSATA